MSCSSHIVQNTSNLCGSDWIRDFKLPKQFSLRTMKVLQGKDRMDITNAVRCEIITSISTLVMVHTISPTPEHYTLIAQRIVSEYPILADSYGCGYVSIGSYQYYAYLFFPGGEIAYILSDWLPAAYNCFVYHLASITILS